MTNQEMNQKVAEIRKIEAEAELDTRKVDNVNTGLYNIIYKAYSQKRVDNDKLKAEGLYNKFLKESVNLRFQINDVKVFA